MEGIFFFKCFWKKKPHEGHILLLYMFPSLVFEQEKGNPRKYIEWNFYCLFCKVTVDWVAHLKIKHQKEKKKKVFQHFMCRAWRMMSTNIFFSAGNVEEGLIAESMEFIILQEICKNIRFYRKTRILTVRALWSTTFDLADRTEK